MADLEDFKKHPRKQLFERISDARCVMLGSTNPADHMQPMSPQIDEDKGRHIWFYGDNTSELGKAVLANPGTVMMCHMDKDYQACVQGRLEVENDRTLVEHFWSPHVASWYPGDKADPKLMMLRFTPEHAGVWASTGNPLKYMYEITKANLNDEMPDVGDHKEIDL